MKSLISLLIILLIQLNVNAQEAVVKNNGGSSAMENGLILGGLRVDNFKANDLEYSDIKGSPYVEKDAMLGRLQMIDEKLTELVPLQYDIYSDEFFYVNEKKEELLLELKLVKEITMQGKEETYLFKRINPHDPHKFYEVLYEGDALDIYNDMDINFYEGKEQGITNTPPRFSRDDQYYVLQKGKEPKKLKLKKKDVLKLFSKDDQKKMTDLSKELKIKLKKSKDFKKLFAAMKHNN